MFLNRAIRIALAGGAVGMVLAGCGGPSPYEFDEFDLMPAEDEVVEFSLGRFEVPVPIPRGFGAHSVSRKRIELSFELHALVSRDYQPQLEDLWERHEGNIRDRVIRVCRNASLDELQEPEFATLKSHLTDCVQNELGPKTIRRLMFTEVKTRGI